MNIKMTLRITGRIYILEALLMMLPFGVSIYYQEACAWSFLVSALVAALAGGLMSLSKPERKTFYAREGFSIVALSWIGMSVFGALPFYLSREIPHFIDALFETVSGFTTTGASILTQVEGMSLGLLFWRSFTHWIGGMGVLVLFMAVLPAGDNSMHIIRAEMPGPAVEKFVPKIRDTAKLLYTIYLVMTIIEILLLLAGGMNLYDSAVHSFGTAGTGGFSTRNASIAAYDSPYIQWVITIFMILFGVNFSLYYLLLLGKLKKVLHSEELRWYLGIIGIAIVVITVNIFNRYGTLSEALRHASFQVASIITTTGYATTDFNVWPQLSRMILVLLMFCGACAGSTGGGMKVSRVIILWKSIKRDLSCMVHPRSVKMVRFEDKVVDDVRVHSVNVFFVLYALLAAGTVLLLSLDGFDFETNFTAMMACLNNIGPGLGMVGPTGNFSQFSYFSKIILSINMLLGRLEIYPILLLMLPASWKSRQSIK